ncbi:phage tail-collar fiber domain-containing protein [Pseudomonas sp. Ma2-10]
MIDQNSQFFAILTNVGAAKQANADALGIAWKITQMGVGDANNTDPLPSATQTSLISEWRRAPLNQLKVDPNNAAIIIAEQVIPADVGGRWIREIGLYDADGDLVAVANCAPSFKPLLNQGSGRTQVVRMNLQVSNASSVELKIDPSVVLATRSYVDQKVVDELGRLDFKQSVRVAATAAIVLSGLQTVDGVALVSGDRVLVPLQAAAKDNGIYVVAAGAWARSADADLGAEVTASMFVPVEEGGVNGDSLWQLVTNGSIVLGATALAFEMLAGRTGIQAGTYKSLTVDKYGRAIGGSSPSTLAGMGITDTYTKTEIEAMIAQASSLPVGAQVSFPVNKVPPGFLERDGSVKSIALYPDLAAFLGGAFNKGDEGAGNFRLPESRGEGERGWDHGRGVDAGRAVGSWQQATGVYPLVGSDGNVLTVNLTDADGGLNPMPHPSYTLMTKTANYSTMPVASQFVRTRNVAVVMCIKAWNAPINQGNIDIAALAAMVQALQVNGPVAGTFRNAKMTVAVASASATFTADEVVVGDGVSRLSYRLTALNKAINLATEGVGGMDVGTAPASGYVALYAIFNPLSGMAKILATNATAGVAPNIYTGANMPAGYTASALIGVWPTNASKQFVMGHQVDREVHLAYVSVLGTAVQQPAFTALSLAGAIPPNAKKVSVLVNITSTAPSGGILDTAGSASGIGTKNLNFTSSAAGQWGLQAMHENIPLITPQTIYYIATNSSGTPAFSIFVTSYTF